MSKEKSSSKKAGKGKSAKVTKTSVKAVQVEAAKHFQFIYGRIYSPFFVITACEEYAKHVGTAHVKHDADYINITRVLFAPVTIGEIEKAVGSLKRMIAISKEKEATTFDLTSKYNCPIQTKHPQTYGSMLKMFENMLTKVRAYRQKNVQLAA